MLGTSFLSESSNEKDQTYIFLPEKKRGKGLLRGNQRKAKHDGGLSIASMFFFCCTTR